MHIPSQLDQIEKYEGVTPRGRAQVRSGFRHGIFQGLCEPARITVLRELILLGRADIGAIAARLPQDRSVVARHLHQLAASQIVIAQKEGRHVFYQIDAARVAERLEGILEITRMLASAMGDRAKVA